MRTMDSLAGSTTDRRMWRRLLPLCNLVLATCLILLGHYQQRRAEEDRLRQAEAVQSQTRGVGEWTPPPRLVLAPATQVAYAVDFPALIVTVPFKLLNANAVTLDIAFCCGVIPVWYFVGLIIDSRARVPNVSRIALLVLSGAGPSFRWFNPDAGALPLSRFVRQGGGFDFPFPEATRKNWHAPVHSRAHETTMRICPGV
jgi:hypothetical protein